MSSAARQETGRQLLLARQCVYRLASIALADPRRGACGVLYDGASQRLATAAIELLKNLPAVRNVELAFGELPPAQLDGAKLFAELPASFEEHNALFESTFGLVVSGACPPYETEYIHSRFTFQRSNAMADVAGFYRAFGMATAAQSPERPDHLSLQLEFMATLCGLEERAATDASGNALKARICRRAQRRFLEEHLAWWAPAFARLLGHAAGGTFYAAAGDLLRAWIPLERALLDVPPPQRPVQTASAELPEDCEGCGIVAVSGPDGVPD